MVDIFMEQLIEFPMAQNDVFTGLPSLPRGYCLCYQYNVDQRGYGPYGFNTTTASYFLRTLFPTLLLWEPERQTLESVTEPTQEGVYFSKSQPRTLKLEEELENYKKNVKIESLRKKYGKTSTPTSQTIKPALIELTEGKKISARIASTLIAHEYFFLINHFFMSDARSTIIFFDKNIQEKAKKIANEINITYITLSSVDDLKPW